MNVSLVPIPPEQAAASCANCGAALVADQRYCLSCGHACSPTRLAFLDVLQDAAGAPGGPPAAGLAAPETLTLTPAGYLPAEAAGGANGWLRRNSGLMSLLGVLLLCLLVGLLVGHWVSQSQGTRAPGKQVVEVRGLSALPEAAAGTSTAGGAGVETPAASKASAKEEAQAAKEAAKETKAEKAPPPPPVKVAPAKLKKLSTTTGKKHAEEVNALGAQPIETG